NEYLATEPKRHGEEPASCSAPDAAPRTAGEARKQQTNDNWAVARSFVCGLRASRGGLLCRPTASGASVSRCLRGLSKSIRRRNYEMPVQYVGVITKCLYLVVCQLLLPYLPLRGTFFVDDDRGLSRSRRISLT